jgi:hypothetical protein
MHSKRQHEGYFMLDHRHAGAPMSDAEVRRARLPKGAGRGLFEAPTYTCSHCQVVVVLNPRRTRDRPHCKKCDHYVCDRCGAALAQTGICRPFKQIIDEVQNAAAKGQPISTIILPFGV